MKKKTLYIDMDGVIVNFQSGIDKLPIAVQTEYEDRFDEVDGIFGLMDPMTGALDSIAFLAEHFEIYILSTAPWNNPSAWIDKVKWIQEHLPEIAYKRLILSHNKHLNIGEYLIDDRLKNGADRFTGEHLHFGQEELKDWNAIVEYLSKKENL